MTILLAITAHQRRCPLPQIFSGRSLRAARLDQHIKRPQSRIIVPCFFGRIPPKCFGSAFHDPLWIPAPRECPIFHPPSNVIHLVVHGAKVVRDVAGETAGIPRISTGNGMLGSLIRGILLQIRRRTPFIPNHLHPPMKRQPNREQMTPKKFVNAPSRRGLHTLLGVVRGNVKGEVAVGVDAVFLAFVAAVAEGVGGGDDYGAAGGDEAGEPLAEGGWYVLLGC
mmetsp:Transcript_23671/g.43467  ORF Transcript_23671/g.43467 Transcript_23671/m.43467 type:complete len:224 (+) Transcript_23671:1473-2144(+)